MDGTSPEKASHPGSTRIATEPEMLYFVKLFDSDESSDANEPHEAPKAPENPTLCGLQRQAGGPRPRAPSCLL
jgi:hypothetical protein